ncbi:alpha-galactosidase A [Colletotrichum zoysiae]|uniref:Alpha-galactosidase A n=1 Tax=Colletotrichum zoysiae TaxID=1216348 RepID=A0AAD9HMP7_9PEZI|nr:alpha-galactosidase A [Colletotrichum zoysiae]
MDSKPPSPEVLSMETSTRDDSYFRIRYNDKVKYVVVTRGTFNSDELCLPLYSLPPLPYEDDGWTVARVSRNPGSPQLQFVLENRPLQGVKEIWHPEQVDCLALKRVQRLTMNVSECTRKGQEAPQSTFIAKIARFEWEIPRIEQEGHVYRLLQDTDIGPQFLGHVVEQGRVIGFVLEKLHGKSASIEHRARCTEVLGRLHRLGLLHGDVNRHNFILGDGWTKMIDFEKSKETHDEGLFKAEMSSLSSELEDESGRGAGFL